MSQKIYETEDFPSFPGVMQKVLAFVANNEGVTVPTILANVHVAPHYLRKRVTEFYGKDILKSAGFSRKLSANGHRQRLYKIGEKAFVEKKKPVRYAKPMNRVIDPVYYASKADDAAQQAIIEVARQHGRFGILVAQATIKQKRRVKNHV